MRRVDDSLLELMTPADRDRAIEASRDAHSVEFVADPIVMGTAISRVLKGRVVIVTSSRSVVSIHVDESPQSPSLTY